MRFTLKVYRSGESGCPFGGNEGWGDSDGEDGREVDRVDVLGIDTLHKETVQVAREGCVEAVLMLEDGLGADVGHHHD